jgi:hypothetical protein
MDITSAVPNRNHQNEAIEFIKGSLDYNSYLAGTAGLHHYINNYNGWLRKLKNDEKCSFFIFGL